MKEREVDQSWVWHNGELLPEGEGSVSIGDWGLLFGFGLFETLRSYRGVAFAWDRHFERLRCGCDVLGISAPEEVELRAGLAALVERNGLLQVDARIRITVTGQEGENVLITAETLPEFPRAFRVVTGNFVRNDQGLLRGLKSTSYAENMLAMRVASRERGQEVLWKNTRNELCEGATSNVFVIRDGDVFTPPLRSGCLPGVTREILLEVAGRIGCAIEERPVAMTELDSADGLLLSSSLKEVLPVSHCDGRRMKSDLEVAQTLMKAFARYRDQVLERGGLTSG